MQKFILFMPHGCIDSFFKPGLTLVAYDVLPINATQNLSTLKIDELTPLTPEVISRQATINIGE
jgi:hypothetical protein